MEMQFRTHHALATQRLALYLPEDDVADRRAPQVRPAPPEARPGRRPDDVQVKVVGPPEQIDELRRSEAQVHAVLAVGVDSARNPTPQPVKIDGLPPDVRLVDAPPTVGFTATPQSH